MQQLPEVFYLQMNFFSSFTFLDLSSLVSSTRSVPSTTAPAVSFPSFSLPPPPQSNQLFQPNLSSMFSSESYRGATARRGRPPRTSPRRGSTSSRGGNNRWVYNNSSSRGRSSIRPNSDWYGETDGPNMDQSSTRTSWTPWGTNNHFVEPNYPESNRGGSTTNRERPAGPNREHRLVFVCKKRKIEKTSWSSCDFFITPPKFFP